MHPTITTKPTSPTAAHLERAIAVSGRSQKEIAGLSGFPRPNVISMMKSGEMKVPIERVPALARACDTDPVKFVLIAMHEYQPEVLQVLREADVSDMDLAELDLLATYRLAEEHAPVPFNALTSTLFFELFRTLAITAAER